MHFHFDRKVNGKLFFKYARTRAIQWGSRRPCEQLFPHVGNGGVELAASKQFNWICVYCSECAKRYFVKYPNGMYQVPCTYPMIEWNYVFTDQMARSTLRISLHFSDTIQREFFRWHLYDDWWEWKSVFFSVANTPPLLAPAEEILKRNKVESDFLLLYFCVFLRTRPQWLPLRKHCPKITSFRQRTPFGTGAGRLQ